MGRKSKKQRNVWRSYETRCLLDIFKEKKILHLLEKRSSSVHEIYRRIEKEMIKRGVISKTAKQIKNKWCQMKSAYVCIQKNHRVDIYLSKDLEFRDDVEKLLQSTIDEQIEDIDLDTLFNTESHPDEITENSKFSEIVKESEYVKKNFIAEPVVMKPITKPFESDIKPKSGKKLRQGSYSKSFHRFLRKLKLAQKDIQNEFIGKQKRLLQVERYLRTERDERLIKALATNVKAIIDTTNLIFS